MVLVRDDGPLNARLVLIGEAPGTREEAAGRPFVGPSGGRLEVWWRRVGLTRGDFYITNVLPYRPENIDKVPREEVEEHMAALRARLAKLDGPVVIVPTGNYALYAITGKGKVSWHKKDGRLVRPGIMDWRGSILSYNGTKVIPTIHPAHVLRTPSLERRAILDWMRIAEEVEFPELNLPDVFHQINPTIEDVEAFVDEALAARRPLGLDIETPKGRVTEFQMRDGSWRANVKKSEEGEVAVYKSGKKKGQLKMRNKPGRSYIGCIGLAHHRHESIVVSLTMDYWKSRDKLERAKAAVNRLLDSDLPLVVQNGVSFDLPRLEHDGYTVRRFLANGRGRPIFDTRAMHHCLDPRDDHDLAYMASILTRFPFWKHEAKDPEEITKYASNSEALRTYCGIDVLSMLAIFYDLRAKLEARGKLGFYYRHYTRLIPAILDMTAHGVNVDDERRAELLDVLNEQAAVMTVDIAREAGMSLVARKGLSNARLKFLFYGMRGFEGAKAEVTYVKLCKEYPDIVPYNLPPVRKKNTKGGSSITVDEVTLRKLILKHPKIAKLGKLLLEYRRNRKKAEFLDGNALDADRRLRCSYSFVTEAARFASSSTPWGTGRNLQNIDRELRFVFIPDKEANE